MGSQLISVGIEVLVQTAVILLVPVIVGIAVQVLRRVGLQVSASQQARMQAIAENAVLAAEEWAVARAKRKFPVSSDQKLERALETILYKVPGIDREEAKELVDAALPKVGLGATDFLRQLKAAQRP